jgi:hypothetical protein
VEEQDDGTVTGSLVDVVDAQWVVIVTARDIEVVRLERVVGESDESFVGGAQGFHRRTPAFVVGMVLIVCP